MYVYVKEQPPEEWGGGGRGKGLCHSEIHWYITYVHVKDASASERRYG
jgi:hypothetical protein